MIISMKLYYGEKYYHVNGRCIQREYEVLSMQESGINHEFFLNEVEIKNIIENYDTDGSVKTALNEAKYFSVNVFKEALKFEYKIISSTTGIEMEKLSG